MKIFYEAPMSLVLLEMENEDYKNVSELTERSTYEEISKKMRLISKYDIPTIERAIEVMRGLAYGNVATEVIDFLHINKIETVVAHSVLHKGLAENGFRPVDPGSELLFRTIKKHMPKILGTTKDVLEQQQSAIAYAFSREKLHIDASRDDQTLIQNVRMYDQISEDITKNFVRVREMYSWHFPELKGIVSDVMQYLEMMDIVGIRTNTDRKYIEKRIAESKFSDSLKEVQGEVILAAETSIGSIMRERDFENMKKVVGIIEKKCAILTVIEKRLEVLCRKICPNLKELLGPALAARLISQAGSLQTLAKYSASTVQMLGAEKALFKALKAKTNTPKYGIMFGAEVVKKAKGKEKGRISRFISAKCTIAARVDCFSRNPGNSIGLALRKYAEERLEFGSAFTKEKTTEDVLREVVSDAHL